MSSQDPQRLLDTQAALAREPKVARNVLANPKLAGLTSDQFLRNSSVAEKPGANLLVFSVTDRQPTRATYLAAEYAKQYVLFERELDTGALQTALAKVRTRIAGLGPRERGSALQASLSDKELELETALTLQTSIASVVRIPDSAQKVQPRPVRNGILGFALGLIMGLALAVFSNALDSRAQTAGGIASETGLTLLARIPKPARRLRRKNRLIMLADPSDPHAEAVRTLKRNVKFANLETRARTIMITSAVEREGKSTTAANLAVAFARAGDRVILVDLDLRRPFIHRFFDHESRPGITDVVLGQLELGDALFEVAITSGGEHRPAGGGGSRGGGTRIDRISWLRIRGGTTTLSASQTAGSPKRLGRTATGTPLQPLGVLPAGQRLPDPGEFVGTQALAETLAEVSQHADVVVVDSPPLLPFSDALTLSMAVDAMIVVSRIDLVRRNMLTELNRILATCTAVKLGFVLTGAEHDESSAYGYKDYNYRQQADDDPWSADSISQESTPRTAESTGSSA